MAALLLMPAKVAASVPLNVNPLMLLLFMLTATVATPVLTIMLLAAVPLALVALFVIWLLLIFTVAADAPFVIATNAPVVAVVYVQPVTVLLLIEIVFPAAVEPAAFSIAVRLDVV